jgi:hypothetical protein
LGRIGKELRGRTNRRKRTLLKTIRITKEIDDLLHKDARDKRISVNALISIVMTKYAEMDRYNEKFGTITLRRESLKTILNYITEDEIKNIAQEMGSRIPKEFMLLWFKNVNLEAYLEYLSLICRYNGFAEYEVELEEEGEEGGKIGRYSITLVHDMGEKWSKFLMELIDIGMRNTLGMRPNFDTSKNSVIVRFNS